MRHQGRAYTLTFVGLLALTTATLLLSFVHLGAASMVLAMAIASGKALLVALFFMHLVEARAGSWLAMAVAVALVATLVGLAFLDVLTRAPVPLP